MAMVEMRSHLAIERARLVTLHLQQARRSSIPTTANGKTVVDASESRAKVMLVALAIRAPASARTRRTLAGVGKAESIEFHGS